MKTTSIVFCLVYFMEPWEADAAGTKAEMRGMTRGTEAERVRCPSAERFRRVGNITSI